MSKRQEIREKRRKQQSTQRIVTISIISVAAVILVALLVFTNLPKPVGAITVPTEYPRPQANMNSMGDPNAPVKIVEYMDFQCPYCGDFSKSTEHLIVDNYVKTGKVYYTIRSMGNFVSDNINRGTAGNNQESAQAAQAAYCAGDQGKYWEYHDILFANQQSENGGYFGRNYLDTFAQKLGLDTAAFKSCMDSQKYASKVTQDGVDGQQAITTAKNYDGSGVGTPSFLINGVLLAGNQPFSTFQKQIDTALAAAK